MVTPRRSPRIECETHAYWNRWRDRQEGRTARINAHGMFVCTPHELPVGYMMELNIVIGARVINCTAVPRFVGQSPDGHGIGFEFHVMAPGDREAWLQFYRDVLAQKGRAWRR